MCNPRNQWQLDMWHERTILFTQVDPTSLGEGEPTKKERERGKIFRERNFTFSLEFPAIRQSNPGEPRDKVAPPRQELRVDTGFVEFRQLREVGVFSYLVYFRLKSHLKWFELYEVVSGHLISPENWDYMLKISGPVLDSPGLILD